MRTRRSAARGGGPGREEGLCRHRRGHGCLRPDGRPGVQFSGDQQASADEFERIFGVRPRNGDNMLDLLKDKPEHRAAVERVWSRALSGEVFTEIDAFGESTLDRGSARDEMQVHSGATMAKVIAAYQFVYDVTDRVREPRASSRRPKTPSAKPENGSGWPAGVGSGARL